MRLSQPAFAGVGQFRSGKAPVSNKSAQIQTNPSLSSGSDILSLKKNPRSEPQKTTPRFAGVFHIRDMEAFSHIEHRIPTIPETKGDVRWYYPNDGRKLLVTGKDAAKVRDLEQLNDDEDLPDDGAIRSSILHETDLLKNVRPQSELLDPAKH